MTLLRSFRASRAPLLGAALTLVAAAALAAQNTDFSGAWRLDDRRSDSADGLTQAMRVEARKELAARQQPAAPASSSSSATPANSGHGGGRHGGGMGGGGMGGGGMGGGGHGGGHVGHRGDNAAGKPADSGDKDPIASATYPMPPMLQNDSVLVVQQDAKSFQVHLSNGDQLAGKLDGVARQSLNGNAMVRGQLMGGQLVVNIRYADGTQLDQTWAMSADGQQMVVSGAWKVPTLEQPVGFRRVYVGLH